MRWIIPEQVYWVPLEPTWMCEFRHCKRKAYKECKFKVKGCLCHNIFVGCNKSFCVPHSHYKATPQNTLEYYCCRDCKEKIK